jgi:hypothetical protein
MTSIKHRHSPETLPNEALLPSQRALLALEQPFQQFSFTGLSDTAVNQMGEFLAYDLSLVVDARFQAEEKLEEGDKRHYRQTIDELGMLANRLLRAGPNYDPYEGFDRGVVKITDKTHVRATVQDNYETYDRYSERGAHDPKYGTFTPQGLVHNPPEDFQQKIIAIDMENESYYAEDAYFNFSAKGHLFLYTDNLSAETPFWEYSEHANITDIFPARRYEPYFFHAVPKRIVGEDLAFSVVESLARVFATSAREEHEKEAAGQARLETPTPDF